MKYFVVDAFADNMFGGNQAGVCLVDVTLDEDTMQKIAAENNLSETAFIAPKKDKDNDTYDYELRWFTPTVEIDLCGHATLASAFIISNFVDENMRTMRFNTMSGILTVTKKEDGMLEMDFPSRKPVKAEVTKLMGEALGVPVLEAHLSRDMLLLVESEKEVKSLSPNLELLSHIPDCFAVIVTAKGEEVDFVSRFFAPNAGVDEDPVTGSAHVTLIPFWAERLNKDKMIAKQLSKRGGTLFCEDSGERVKISGSAVLYLSGEIHV